MRKDDLKFIGYALLLVVALFFSIATAVHWAEYVSATAAVEQLRTDIDRVGGVVSEDIAGQATSWNQRIRRAQRWNDVPFVGLTFPNGWDDIAIIDLDTGR